MNCERFRAQTIDRLRGALSAAEERAMAEHQSSCPACAAEAAAVEEAWLALGRLPEEEPRPAVADRFYAFLAHAAVPPAVLGEGALPPKRSWAERLSFLWPRQPALQAAVVGLALVGGFVLGNFGRRGEMGELRGEVRTLQHMVALSLLERGSASERLRGVSLSSSTDTTDPQVLSALLDAVRNDQSVNVRLAAIDALAPRAGRPQVRAELLAALARESSPLVQVAIADAVLASDDDDARIELEQSLRDTRLDPEVKTYVDRRLREAA